MERGAAPTTCDMAMSIGTDVIAGSKRNSGRATPATAIDTGRVADCPPHDAVILHCSAGGVDGCIGHSG